MTAMAQIRKYKEIQSKKSRINRHLPSGPRLQQLPSLAYPEIMNPQFPHEFTAAFPLSQLLHTGETKVMQSRERNSEQSLHCQCRSLGNYNYSLPSLCLGAQKVVKDPSLLSEGQLQQTSKLMMKHRSGSSPASWFALFKPWRGEQSVLQQGIQ